jgi:hypothetical protein
MHPASGHALLGLPETAVCPISSHAPRWTFNMQLGLLGQTRRRVDAGDQVPEAIRGAQRRLPRSLKERVSDKSNLAPEQANREAKAWDPACQNPRHAVSGSKARADVVEIRTRTQKRGLRVLSSPSKACFVSFQASLS